MIRYIRNYYQKNKTRTHILVIVLFVIVAFGIQNIQNLGLISDDWDTFRVIYLFHAKSFDNVFTFFIWQSGIGILQRPYWLFFLPFQLILFQDRIMLYHLFTEFLFIITAINLYISLVKIGLNKLFSLYVIIFFILFPVHFASMFWLSAQMSLFSMFFLSMAFLSLSIKNNIFRFFSLFFFLFVSLITYEIGFGFLFFLSAITFFIENPIRLNIKEKVIQIFAIFSSLGAYILYKRWVIFISGIDKYVKEPSFNISVSEQLFIIKNSLHSFFGPGFYKFIIQQLGHINVLSNLSGKILLLFASMILIVFLLFITKLSIQKGIIIKDKDRLIQGFSFFAVLLTIISFIPTKNVLSLGGINDRLNLSISFFVSIFIVILFYSFLKNYMFVLLTFLFVCFSLFNWIALESYIKSYAIQLDFMGDLRNINIDDNTLIVFDTNAYYYNQVPILNTIWGNSYMISSLKQIEHVETISANTYNLNNLAYHTSKLDNRYLYLKPKILYIRYYNKELE